MLNSNFFSLQDLFASPFRCEEKELNQVIKEANVALAYIHFVDSFFFRPLGYVLPDSIHGYFTGSAVQSLNSMAAAVLRVIVYGHI